MKPNFIIWSNCLTLFFSLGMVSHTSQDVQKKGLPEPIRQYLSFYERL